MKEGGGGGGEKPSNPHVIHVTSHGCFGVGLCWDLGMFQAMLDITSEQNVSNNNNQLFSAVFHLTVNLGWFPTDLLKHTTNPCHHVYLAWN